MVRYACEAENRIQQEGERARQQAQEHLEAELAKIRSDAQEQAAKHAATLAQLRTSGVGDLYQGALARRLEEASVPAGGGLTLPELREGLARVVAPVQVQAGNDVAAFPPAAVDGGITVPSAAEQGPPSTARWIFSLMAWTTGR